MLPLKLLLGCGLLGWSASLPAQDTLLVKKQDNTLLKYSLENVKSLTFPPGTIAVNATQSSGDLLAVATVKTAFFKATGLALELEDKGVANSPLSVRFSPNPLAGEVLTIDYETAYAGSVLIEFLNVSGRVEKQILAQSRKGANEMLVDTQELGAGLYICRVKSGDTVSVGKIMKY